MFVRCLKIKFNSKVKNFLKEFLVKTPNLEELTIENLTPVPYVSSFLLSRQGGCCGGIANLRNDDDTNSDLEM